MQDICRASPSELNGRDSYAPGLPPHAVFEKNMHAFILKQMVAHSRQQVVSLADCSTNISLQSHHDDSKCGLWIR